MMAKKKSTEKYVKPLQILNIDGYYETYFCLLA